MLRRETLDEFDIYRDIVELRVKADARDIGSRRYRQVARKLGSYAADSDFRETMAAGEAKAAERKFLAEWRRGQHRYGFGLGVGLRALLRPGREDLLIDTFVASAPELSRGAPEVVEVTMPDSDEVLTGLILPEGTFRFSGLRATRSMHEITFFSKASQTGPYAAEPLPGPQRTLLPHQVVAISDAGGAYWDRPTAAQPRQHSQELQAAWLD